MDDALLYFAASRGCRRIGLFIGGDSYDYPLTWRAMQAGMETRHVAPGDPWPCLVFTDGTVEIPASAPWRPYRVPFVLVNVAGGADVVPAGAAQPSSP